MDDEVTPLVEMIGVSKSYGGVRACRDVQLTVLIVLLVRRGFGILQTQLITKENATAYTKANGG